MPRDRAAPGLAQPASSAALALVVLLHVGLVLLLMHELEPDLPLPPPPNVVTVAVMARPAARSPVAPPPALPAPVLAPPPMMASTMPRVPMPELALATPAPPPRHDRPEPHAAETAAKPTEPPPRAAAAAVNPAGPADRNPIALPDNPAPAYPELARRKGFEGTVVLRVVVSAAGQPTAITLAASSGHDLLDDRAIETVWRWRFLPALAKGQAIAGLVLLPITFQLRA